MFAQRWSCVPDGRVCVYQMLAAEEATCMYDIDLLRLLLSYDLVHYLVSLTAAVQYDLIIHGNAIADALLLLCTITVHQSCIPLHSLLSLRLCSGIIQPAVCLLLVL